MIKTKCENCRFFEDGLCKRSPPKFTLQYNNIQGRDQSIVAYPDVSKNDWCGEWRSK